MNPTVITTGPWAAMIAAAGGVQDLADALGVGRVPMYRWATGKSVPSIFVRKHVNAWARRRGLEAPFGEE